MKKNYLLLGLFALGMMALQGCDEKNGGSGDSDELEFDSGLNGKMEEIAPSESKSRLQEIGLEFVNAIDATTHENLVDVVAYMEEEFDYLDIDEDYYEKLENLYTETGGYDDYYAAARKVDPVAATQGLMALSLDAAQSGAQLATRADDIYMFTLQAGLKDLYGGFKPNWESEEWEYDESITDRLEVEFTDDHNQKWVATLKGSKETTRVHIAVEFLTKWKETYDYGESDEPEVYEGGHQGKYDYSIDVPKVITFVVKCNQEEIINLAVNSSLALDVDAYEGYNDESYRGYDENGNWFYESEYESKLDLKVDYTNLNLDASLNVNGYAETWKTEASKSGIESTAEVKIDGKSMLKAEAALAADVNALIKQINDANTYSGSYSSNDDDEYDDDDYEFDPKALKGFAMKLDVMGKAQVYGKCDSFKKLYDAMDMTDEEYEEKYGDMSEDEAYEKYVDEFNKTFSVTIHYDNKETVQANVELEAVIEDHVTYTDHYTRPVLVFAADNSRYSLEDYFTEGSFNDLMEAVDDLIEEFEDMYSEYFEEENVPIAPDNNEGYYE